MVYFAELTNFGWCVTENGRSWHLTEPQWRARGLPDPWVAAQLGVSFIAYKPMAASDNPPGTG
jgi:hypothetical protein